MEACSKALAVLNSDDAHDLFTNMFNPVLEKKKDRLHCSACILEQQPSTVCCWELLSLGILVIFIPFSKPLLGKRTPALYFFLECVSV